MKIDAAKAVQTIQDLRERERMAALLLTNLVTFVELGEKPDDVLIAEARRYLISRRGQR